MQTTANADLSAVQAIAIPKKKLHYWFKTRIGYRYPACLDKANLQLYKRRYRHPVAIRKTLIGAYGSDTTAAQSLMKILASDMEPYIKELILQKIKECSSLAGVNINPICQLLPNLSPHQKNLALELMGKITITKSHIYDIYRAIQHFPDAPEKCGDLMIKISERPGAAQEFIRQADLIIADTKDNYLRTRILQILKVFTQKAKPEQKPQIAKRFVPFLEKQWDQETIILLLELLGATGVQGIDQINRLLTYITTHSELMKFQRVAIAVADFGNNQKNATKIIQAVYEWLRQLGADSHKQRYKKEITFCAEVVYKIASLHSIKEDPKEKQVNSQKIDYGRVCLSAIWQDSVEELSDVKKLAQSLGWEK